MKTSVAMLSAVAIFACACLPASVSATQVAQASCVTLYEHINFKGRSIRFCSDDSTLVNNNWNDIASSARVTGGNGVVLYQHINYKGHRLVLKPGSYSNFTKIKMGNRTWNDVVSSVNIR